MNTSHLTDKEWVQNEIENSKKFYKTPENMIDEHIKLLEGLKVNMKDDKEKMWEMISAVSNAYHIVLFSQKQEDSKRLVRTIFAYVSENVV